MLQFTLQSIVNNLQEEGKWILVLKWQCISKTEQYEILPIERLRFIVEYYWVEIFWGNDITENWWHINFQ